MENLKAPSADDFMSYYEITDKVMNQYTCHVNSIESIKFKDTDKQRAVYKLSTSEGMYCLKKVYYDKATLLFIYSVVEWLNLNSISCPRFISTKKGIKYAEYKGNLFILTEWIEGRKCNYDQLEDINQAAFCLGRMHRTSYGFKPIAGSNCRTNEELYFSSLNKHFLQLLDLSNTASSLKDNFSRLYLETFEYNADSAKRSLEILSKVDTSKPIGDRVSMSAICHHDYVNKNIIFSKNNHIYIIDFDRTAMDMPVHDIISFIKRIMKRDNTCWDFNVFKSSMEAYEQSRQISYNEYLLVLSYLMFPHKYWKISRDYYKNLHQCNKEAFLTILIKTSGKNENHQQFCMELKDYIENKFNKKI
jgi:CotS family spore coat protein